MFDFWIYFNFVDTANYGGLNQSGNKLSTRCVAPSTNNYGVNTGALYISQYFNNGGWRFTGYNFFAADNNGPYLYWEQWSPDFRCVGTNYIILAHLLVMYLVFHVGCLVTQHTTHSILTTNVTVFLIQINNKKSLGIYI